MAATVTVTGTYGPGLTATATVIQSVSSFRVNCDSNLLIVNLSAGQIREFGISSATTITATKSGSTYTLTIS